MKQHYKWVVRPETSFSAFLHLLGKSKLDSQALVTQPWAWHRGELAQPSSYLCSWCLLPWLLWLLLAHCNFQNQAGKLPLGRFAGLGLVIIHTLKKGVARGVDDLLGSGIKYLSWRKGWILDSEADCSTISTRHLWFWKIFLKIQLWIL